MARIASGLAVSPDACYVPSFQRTQPDLNVELLQILSCALDPERRRCSRAASKHASPEKSTGMCGLRRGACWKAVCGASRDRTDDPLLAKQVLSQLSYGPVRAERVG
jgi:hypothetical protein